MADFWRHGVTSRAGVCKASRYLGLGRLEDATRSGIRVIKYPLPWLLRDVWPRKGNSIHLSNSSKNASLPLIVLMLFDPIPIAAANATLVTRLLALKHSDYE